MVIQRFMKAMTQCFNVLLKHVSKTTLPNMDLIMHMLKVYPNFHLVPQPEGLFYLISKRQEVS